MDKIFIKYRPQIFCFVMWMCCAGYSCFTDIFLALENSVFCLFWQFYSLHFAIEICHLNFQKRKKIQFKTGKAICKTVGHSGKTALSAHVRTNMCFGRNNALTELQQTMFVGINISKNGCLYNYFFVVTARPTVL